MPLICPACRKIHLNPRTDPTTNLEIDICPKCFGIWFDYNELGEFFKSSTLKRKYLLPEYVESTQSVGYVMTSRARPCPRCRAGMVEKLYGDVSIDICSSCKGIWLDDGELRRIVSQFEKGKGSDTTINRELSKGLGIGGDIASSGNIIQAIISFFSR